MNTRITYSYRDAGNYKADADAIITGTASMAQEEALRAAAYHEDGADCFVPESLGWDRASLHPWDDSMDHPYHRIESVEATDEDATDKRNMRAIIETFRSMDWEAEGARHSGDAPFTGVTGEIRTHPYGIASSAIMS